MSPGPSRSNLPTPFDAEKKASRSPLDETSLDGGPYQSRLGLSSQEADSLRAPEVGHILSHRQIEVVARAEAIANAITNPALLVPGLVVEDFETRRAAEVVRAHGRGNADGPSRIEIRYFDDGAEHDVTPRRLVPVELRNDYRERLLRNELLPIYHQTERLTELARTETDLLQHLRSESWQGVPELFLRYMTLCDEQQWAQAGGYLGFIVDARRLAITQRSDVAIGFDLTRVFVHRNPPPPSPGPRLRGTITFDIANRCADIGNRPPTPMISPS